MCLARVWRVFVTCLECFWNVFGTCLGRVWDMFETCLGLVRDQKVAKSHRKSQKQRKSQKVRKVSRKSQKRGIYEPLHVRIFASCESSRVQRFARAKIRMCKALHVRANLCTCQAWHVQRFAWPDAKIRTGGANIRTEQRTVVKTNA